MKKIIYILIFISLLFQVSGSICQDVIPSGEDCLMVTPIISCSNYSYMVSDEFQNVVEVGDLSYYGNNSWFFSFVHGVGDYHVSLCDNTTRDVYVVEESRVNDMSSVTSFYGVVVLFLIIIGLSIFLFFYNKDDMWLQVLCLLLGGVTLIFLVVVSIDINDIQNNYSSGFSRFVVGDTDFNSNNLSYYNVSNNNRFLMRFDVFNDVDVDKFNLAKLCFKYNNSDGANVLSVYNFNSKLSGKLVVDSGDVGDVCVDLSNPSNVFNGVYLGVSCLDCVVGNSFGLASDLDASLVDVYVVSINQSYSVVSLNPFVYEVRVRYPPFDSVRKLFFYYLWVMSFFVLAFGSRAIIMYVVKVKEVVEK